MRTNNGHLIAESAADLKGWEIVMTEPFGSGVVRVHMRQIDPWGIGHYQTVYAKQEHIEELKRDKKPLWRK